MSFNVIKLQIEPHGTVIAIYSKKYCYRKEVKLKAILI